MKSLFRISRRYIGIAFFILCVILMMNMCCFAYLVLRYTSSTGIGAKAYDISDEITVDGSDVTITEAGKEMLKQYAFAFLLDESGNTIWEWNMPGKLKRSYSLSEVAAFSRWYIEDYPVTVWQQEPGLLVLGQEEKSIWKGQLTLDYHLASNMVKIVGLLLLCNILLILFFCLFLGYRFYRSLQPVVAGLESLSEEEPVHLKVKGVTADLAEKLNRTSEILQKQKLLIEQRDTARTNWIAGVSHDIRTPLSMIMGYAEQLEEADNLDEEQRHQISIMKNQSVKIKKLIEDLNLTSKLEYQMQPLRMDSYQPARLMREIVTSYYNNGLSEAYSIDLQIEESVERVHLEGDVSLLTRAYENLIGNSIRHNEGCQIVIQISQNESGLRLHFSDNGVGIPPMVIDRMNTDHIQSNKDTAENQEMIHIMGMRVVKQIILAHHGQMFVEKGPSGASIQIVLPI